MGSAADFYAQYLLDSLSQLGVSGLPNWQDLGAGRVDIGVLDQAWQLGLDQAGPDVALRVGALVTPRAIDVLGYASMASDTLGEALQLTVLFEPYRLGFVSCALQSGADQDTVSVTMTAQAGQSALASLHIEAAFVGWVQFGRWIAATDKRPVQVCFAHPRQAPLAVYEARFGCPVLFDQPCNEVVLDLADLHLPLAAPNPIVKALMRTTLQERVHQFEQGDYWMARIQAQMDAQLPLGEPTLQSVSDALQVPSGIITKALMQAQTSFASLLDAQRQRCLKQYLKTEMPLLQVAMQLGYSEQSALTRACKRWFGMTPGALRRQLQGQGD